MKGIERKYEKREKQKEKHTQKRKKKHPKLYKKKNDNNNKHLMEITTRNKSLK